MSNLKLFKPLVEAVCNRIDVRVGYQIHNKTIYLRHFQFHVQKFELFRMGQKKKKHLLDKKSIKNCLA